MEQKFLTARTWVEIDRAAILSNHEQVKKHLPPGTSVMAVVKADAYGHGAVEVAGLLSDRVEAFGVASAWEAFELRRNGIENDILILGGTDASCFRELVEYDVMPSLFDLDAASRLNSVAASRAAALGSASGSGDSGAETSAVETSGAETSETGNSGSGDSRVGPSGAGISGAETFAAETSVAEPSAADTSAADTSAYVRGVGTRPYKAGCFVAVDTGMSRIGFPDTADGVSAISAISRMAHLEIRGIFSHFARADEADKASAQEQLGRFRRFLDRLTAAGISVGKRSISNSAGLMELPDAAFDMVREGIVLYGLSPSSEVTGSGFSLTPALSLKTRVELVKTVPAGTGISYGHLCVTERPTRVATLCAGYADGVPRLLSGRGSVLLHGKRAPILGRVCMDQMMVDVTDIPGVSVGDVATIIGTDGDASISADEVAEASGTISYEILCSLSRPRLPRVYR